MPPKGGSSFGSSSSHSSGSHSSGSGFSFGSGSSHGSGGFGGFFGGSPKHNSPPNKSGGSGRHNPSPKPPGNSFGQPYQARPRRSQPSGSSLSNLILYYGLLHDYQYYPEDFTDSTGKTYKRGYYDENGNYYENVAFENQETELVCPYCGTRNKIIWKEGVLPKCPNCGGEYEDVQVDNVYKGKPGVQTVSDDSSPMNSKFSWLSRIFVILVPLVICIFSFRFFFSDDSGSAEFGVEYSSTSGTYYVAEIGRDCEWDDNVGAWYDDDTQCWFGFNEKVDPPQWQYWYEDISSDFGDYGYMEYDDDKETWYIQDSNGKWIKLPAKYDTSDLWHMDDAFTE